MKKIILLLIILITASGALAQRKEISGRQNFNRGDVEASIFLNIGRYSMSSELSSEQRNDFSSEESVYFQLGAAMGYFLFDGFSFEPELDIVLAFDMASTMALANVCYTFNVSRNNTYPYLKLGYGVSSYKHDYYTPFSEPQTSTMDEGVLNAGAGIKFMYSSGLSLRVELNYRYLNTSDSYTEYYSSSVTKIKSDISIISIMLGLSFLL